MTKKRNRVPLSELQPAERQWVVQVYATRQPRPRFMPPTDVIEFQDHMVVLVEIAGMQADDFQIELLNNYLVISGTRERPLLQGMAYHQVEVSYGDFRVAVALPWLVDQDGVSANYKDGFLQVQLPRQAEKPIRIVSVETEDDTPNILQDASEEDE